MFCRCLRKRRATNEASSLSSLEWIYDVTCRGRFPLASLELLLPYSSASSTQVCLTPLCSPASCRGLNTFMDNLSLPRSISIDSSKRRMTMSNMVTVRGPTQHDMQRALFSGDIASDFISKCVLERRPLYFPYRCVPYILPYC